ncbi:MAG: hypothetical protein JXR68_08400 [Bacteroidales bacterium]|nr:hypothetical protein [Bacteroidales bacterium]
MSGEFLKVFLVFLMLIISSCSMLDNLIEVMLYPYKKPKSFEFYNKDFQLSKDDIFKTEIFYYTKGVGVSGEYYDYFKFYSDGMVYHYGGTSILPNEAYQKKYFNITRKRNGVPNYRKASWGYFYLNNDSLKFSIVDYTALSEDKFKYIGVIKNDSLFLDVYEFNHLHEVFYFAHSSIYVYYSSH